MVSAVNAAGGTVRGIRPELVAAHVATSSGELDGFGIGAYFDARARRDATSLYGTGLTEVSYLGGHAFALSAGYYARGGEHGVTASLALGFRGFVDDAVYRIGVDTPIGLRLDAYTSTGDGPRATSAIASVEVDTSAIAAVVAAPFVAAYWLATWKGH